MQQTAMQTLIDELKDYKRTTHADKLVITFWICMAERLLEKEKEQILDAYTAGSDDEYEYHVNSQNIKRDDIDCDKYYNETFKK